MDRLVNLLPKENLHKIQTYCKKTTQCLKSHKVQTVMGKITINEKEKVLLITISETEKDHQ